MDQLLKYEFGKIFPGCRLVDIHEWLFEKGIRLDGVSGTKYMYHEPCHTPMKHHSGIKVANALMGQQVDLNDRCCGESGTLAVSRPDVSTQIRFRKQQEIEAGAATLRKRSEAEFQSGLMPASTGVTPKPKVGAGDTAVKILTSCPSCLQGLSRYDNDADISADYIVVEMAKSILGPDWMQDYVRAANSGGIERVLL
jgi:Fe-S oxidoreductase